MSVIHLRGPRLPDCAPALGPTRHVCSGVHTGHSSQSLITDLSISVLMSVRSVAAAFVEQA
jgi:hypothetical protein